MTNFSSTGTSGFDGSQADNVAAYAAISASAEAQQSLDEHMYFDAHDFEDSVIDFDDVDAMHDQASDVPNAVEPSFRVFNQPSSAVVQKNAAYINYPRTSLSAEMVEEMTLTGLEEGYVTPPLERCAFTLIENRLVPETFIERVRLEVQNCVFEYGYVLSESAIFSEQFLEALDENERAVLMSVVLLLVARDAFPLHLWTSEVETV